MSMATIRRWQRDVVPSTIRLPAWIGQVSLYLVLILGAVVFAYPLVWMLYSSLKDNPTFFKDPWGLPHQFRWGNYRTAWNQAQLSTAFKNSAVVTLGSLAIILPAATAGAYAFNRMNFRLKWLYRPILFCLAVPLEGMMIPLYILLTRLHLVDTQIGLILCYAATNTPFAMFILGEFFSRLPRSFEEAAELEGASAFTVLTEIMLPLARPAISAVVVLTFLFIWNEFALGVVVINNSDLYTIPLALKVFTGKYFTDYPPLFAGLALSTIPLILIYVLLQRQFVRGLTVGAFRD